jgi:hypothetical protein
MSFDITKTKTSWNSYKTEFSYAQILAIHKALEKHHADAVSDELFEGFTYYVGRLPKPGEDEKNPNMDKDNAEAAITPPDINVPGEPKASPMAKPNVPAKDDIDVDRDLPPPPSDSQ